MKKTYCFLQRFRIILVLIGFIFYNPLASQDLFRYNTFNYGVNEGLLQTTIGDLAIDANNFCWITFPNGIQKFDGKHFIDVRVQEGLPDDKLCHLLESKSGDLFVSHTQGISKYLVSKNAFLHFYQPSKPFSNAALLVGEDEGVMYFYCEDGHLRGFDIESLTIRSDVVTGFPAYSRNSYFAPGFSDNIIGHRIVFFIQGEFYLWDFREQKIIARSPAISSVSYNLLHLLSPTRVLYNTFIPGDGLLVYDFATHKTEKFPLPGTAQKISRCLVRSWQDKMLVSFNNRLFEVTPDLHSIKGELVNFQNEPVPGDFTIADMKADHYGNLFITTITGGLRKLVRNSYPIRFYSSGKGSTNFVITILPDKPRNRILAGTSGHGLLVFDTTQRLIKTISTLPGSAVQMTLTTIVRIDGGYLLFIGGERRLWRLSDDLVTFTSYPIRTTLPDIEAGIDYFSNIISREGNELIVQSQSKLYRVNLATYETTEYGFAKAYVMGGIRVGSQIISHAHDELLFLDAGTFREIKRAPLKNTGYVRCYAHGPGGTIYVGSNKGIYKVNGDGRQLYHIGRDQGLPDECIYAIAVDKDGYLWCSTNKGILKLSDNGQFLQLKKEDGLQENEFNTNAMAVDAGGEMFFGGINGLNSFYPFSFAPGETQPAVLLTGLKINNEDYVKDGAAWALDQLDLTYDKRYFSFDFIAMGPIHPDRYVYQYRMKEMDEQWVQNDGTNPVRYFLQPGRYVFQLYVSSQFDPAAKPMRELVILIHPPFWKTWWFRTLMAIALAGLLIGAVFAYTRRRYEKRLLIREGEQRMQAERERISRDLHDSVGVYANAVLHKTDMLQESADDGSRQELMEDLRFASKDIITSLRETVWALKKEDYTAEECLLRIRNFLQPFTRYYPSIQFLVEGEAPRGLHLPATRALNLVRIIQEAVTNAIKHSGSGTVTIKSGTEDNTWVIRVKDNGRGFERERRQAGNGLGNMEERARQSGFDLVINTGAGQGAEIEVRIT